MASRYPKRARLKPGQKTLAEQQIDRWRDEAADARAMANQFASPEAAKSMREVASVYERMASIKEQKPS
jgi:hypothetical protein